MKQIENLTGNDISSMSYNELIGLTRETNRTPGGLRTVKTISRLLLLNQATKLLDIGTSTGHSAMEFGRLLNCDITGIDINEMSLQVAKERVSNFKLNNIKFLKEDATKMSFANETFDVVFSGNVTSLIDQKEKALSEYWRVLKPNGYLVAVPMYYLSEPPQEVVDKVRKAIRVHITVHTKDDWKTFFTSDNTEIFEDLDYKFIKCTDNEISMFCKNILVRPHLKKLSNNAKRELEDRYFDYMQLFNINLSFMGFTIFVLRRVEGPLFNDPELFSSKQTYSTSKS